MLWLREKVGRCRLLDDAAGLHYRDPVAGLVAGLGNYREIMRNEQHRQTMRSPQLFQQR